MPWILYFPSDLFTLTLTHSLLLYPCIFQTTPTPCLNACLLRAERTAACHPHVWGTSTGLSGLHLMHGTCRQLIGHDSAAGNLPKGVFYTQNWRVELRSFVQHARWDNDDGEETALYGLWRRVPDRNWLTFRWKTLPQYSGSEEATTHMKAVGSSETSVKLLFSTGRYKPEGCIIHLHSMSVGITTTQIFATRKQCPA